MTTNATYNFFYDLQGSFIRGTLKAEYEKFYCLSDAQIVPIGRSQPITVECYNNEYYLNKDFIMFYTKHKD